MSCKERSVYRWTEALMVVVFALVMMVIWHDALTQKVGVLPSCSCSTQPCATTR